MNKRITRIWVHPQFKRKMKVKAAEQNISIIDLTKDMAGELNLKEYVEKKKWFFSENIRKAKRETPY